MEDVSILSAETYVTSALFLSENKTYKADAGNVAYQMARSISVALWVKIYLISTWSFVLICVAGISEHKAICVYLVQISLGYEDVVEA